MAKDYDSRTTRLRRAPGNLGPDEYADYLIKERGWTRKELDMLEECYRDRLSLLRLATFLNRPPDRLQYVAQRLCLQEKYGNLLGQGGWRSLNGRLPGQINYVPSNTFGPISGGCRYIAGEYKYGGPDPFCGAERYNGSSYCKPHYDLCYIPGSNNYAVTKFLLWLIRRGY